MFKNMLEELVVAAVIIFTILAINESANILLDLYNKTK